MNLLAYTIKLLYSNDAKNISRVVTRTDVEMPVQLFNKTSCGIKRTLFKGRGGGSKKLYTSRRLLIPKKVPQNRSNSYLEVIHPLGTLWRSQQPLI